MKIIVNANYALRVENLNNIHVIQRTQYKITHHFALKKKKKKK